MGTKRGKRPEKLVLLVLLLGALGLLPGPWAASGSSSEPGSDEAALAHGAKVYARACASCHGRDGKGDGPGAREMSTLPRDFSVGKYRFRSTLSGQPPMRSDIERAVRFGMPGTSMPAFQGWLSDDSISDVVSYILSLGPANLTAFEPEPLAMPEFPAADPTRLSDGRAIYLIIGCWKCHGVDGLGRGPSAKDLKTDEGERSRPRNFRYAPFKAGRSHEAVARAVASGFIGTPMPSFDEILVMPQEAIDASVESIPEKARPDLEAFRNKAPTVAEFGELDDDQWQALRDENLASLSDYVLSLSRRNRFFYKLFRQNPEQEAWKTGASNGQASQSEAGGPGKGTNE